MLRHLLTSTLLLTSVSCTAIAQHKVFTPPGFYLMGPFEYPTFNQPRVLLSSDRSVAWVYGYQTVAGNFQKLWNLEEDSWPVPWPETLAPVLLAGGGRTAVLSGFYAQSGASSGPPYYLWRDGVLSELAPELRPTAISADGTTLIVSSIDGSSWPPVQQLLLEDGTIDLPLDVDGWNVGWGRVSSTGDIVCGEAWQPFTQQRAFVFWRMHQQPILSPLPDTFLRPNGQNRAISDDCHYIASIESVDENNQELDSVVLRIWSPELGTRNLLNVQRRFNSANATYVGHGGSIVGFVIDTGGWPAIGVNPSPIDYSNASQVWPDFASSILAGLEGSSSLGYGHWSLREVYGYDAKRRLLSTGGMLISYGTVYQPAWLAIRYPKCSADIDMNGFVDSDDFVEFVNRFALGCTRLGFAADLFEPGCVGPADYDHSGFVDSDDFIKFVEDFSTPCD